MYFAYAYDTIVYMKRVKRTGARGLGVVFVFQVLMFFGVVIMSLVSSKNVSAWGYGECLALSGGRQNIGSVQWACSQQASELGVNVCSLWVGGNDSVDPTIYVDNASGIVLIHYYGMCTMAENTTSDIWILNDNYSIDASKNLRRGVWAHPNSIATHLDVGRFVDGATRVSGDGGDIYTRNIQVCRKNEYAATCDSYNGACSCMDETVRVVVRKQFYGKSLVSSSDGTWTSSNGVSVGTNDTFTQTSDKKTYYINNCDPVNGCTVKFWHYLKRQGGTGTTNYIIKRTSNYSSISSGTVVGNTTETFSSGEVVKLREEAFVNKLKPGQVVCETLTFSVNERGETKDLTVCASALGDAVPPESETPSGDRTSLDMKVKNNDVEKYNDYQALVYAKPGDSLSFQSVYNPFLQYAYNLIPEKMRINNSATIFPVSGINNNRLGDLYNVGRVAISSDLRNWQNAYAVNGDFASSFGRNYIYNIGNTERRMNYDEYRVVASQVGKTLDGVAQTNIPDEIKTTPKQISFVKQTIGGIDYNVAQIYTDTLKKTASAKIPYNYRTAINLNTEETTVGAGENGTVDILVDVLTKKNSETTNGGDDEAYATKTGGSAIKLVVYIPGAGTTRNGDENYNLGGGNLCARYSSVALCAEKDIATNKILNSEGNLSGKSGDGVKGATFNVPDLDAGTEICVAAAVYPSNSGSDTNLDVKGNDRWNVSSSKCFTIAKKPSIQIWGAGLFSKKNIKTPVSKKNNVYGYANYDINSKNRFFVFGSFTELDVISLGTVTGLSSGASTGYAHIDNASLWPSYNNNNASNVDALMNYGPGGSYETTANYCLRSVLTFANDTCSHNIAGAIGGSSRNNTEENRNDLIERFKDAKDSKISYENKTSDYTTNENIIVDKGLTRVIDAKGYTITINQDINFLSNQTYISMEEIPKLILFAKNIEITCNVTRIDAVLIAEKDINTCSNSNDINSEMNSRQLMINGSIISNTLSANRTYGAAKGANSIIPAEIINYDTTLYFWGGNKADITNSGKLFTTYLHDVSPRT